MAHALHFPQLDRELRSSGSESLYACARRSGLRIVGACGGRGTCGTCLVRIVDGAGEKGKWVRACQLVPNSDCTLEVAPRSLAPVVRAEPGASAVRAGEPDPAVTGYDLAVPPAGLSDGRSDAERVRCALPVPVTSIDVAAARALPALLRDGDWSLRATLRAGEWIASAPRGAATLGLAVDLGTTNAAAFLLDLQSGVRLGSLGIENPQTAWGADLISRLTCASQDPAVAAELREAAVVAVNALAHDLCAACGVAPADIVDVAVCANTAMHHLLLGLPVRQLGRAPFVAAVSEALDLRARDLGIAVSPGAYVHTPPNAGGFVGGDHVTALLSTEPLWGAGGLALVMDIGTNTEISLIHGDRILSASCPSGPALEGGHISCGMRAAEGAIERVAYRGGRIEVEVIGGREPVGLCGSGVLDAVAALLEAGSLDRRGRLQLGHPAVGEGKGGRFAELASGVHLTQQDIRSVQLAKAAIRSAVGLLLRDAGLVATDIRRFVVAGAFGAYLDTASGVAVGLFPDLPLERFEQVGNAAGAGVQQLLVSLRARQRAADIAARCRCVPLGSRSEFQKAFFANIGFPATAAARAS